MRKLPLPESPVNEATYQCFANTDCPYFGQTKTVRYPMVGETMFAVIHPSCIGCGYECKKVVRGGR